MGFRARAANNEGGFTLIESSIALGVIFTVLVGLLGALTAGTRGLITGRQRSAGLALANEVMEGARALSYGDVGHDFDSDPTLATDPLITGTAPNWMYNGEPLAASAIDAGPSGGTTANPLFPFSPHRFTSQREKTTYTTSVYVTTVNPAIGDPYKRITAMVAWSPAQYATSVKNVTLSSFLFAAEEPPDPKIVGTGEADAGTLRVTGSLAGISLSDAALTLPYVSGAIDSGFVKSAKGLARSGSSEINLLLGLGSVFDPALAQADSDNDSGTAPPDTDQEGPVNVAAGAITAAPALTLNLGSGSAQAQATARSCWLCYPTDPQVGDDDRLPYFYGRGTGPTGVSLDFVAGTVLGKLLSFATSPAAMATVDRDDDPSNNQRITSGASVTFPAVDVLPLTVAPAGYSGMVKVPAASASVLAEAGPGVSNPTVSGAAVNVRFWNGSGYTAVPITPGTASSTTVPLISISSGLATVSVNGSITSTPAVTDITS
ncbi:MAG TPA: hypothetical protein VFF24_12190, partial [Acidimicrobiia bacterium]|nr:hypothetical protein [Acidimicrobiia bacterium]